MSQNTYELVEDFYALMNIPISKRFCNTFKKTELACPESFTNLRHLSSSNSAISNSL